MPSNPYGRASNAYRSATLTLPPVRGIAALLDRTLQHSAAAEHHLLGGRFDAFHREIQAAITVLTGLSLFVAGQMPSPLGDAWNRQCGALIVAFGRVASGRDMRARLGACHQGLSRLRLAWAKAAGLENTVDPIYTAAHVAPARQAAGSTHG